MFIPTGEFRRKGNEVEYKICTFCGNTRWNLTVNLSKQLWHCWACSRGGKLAGTLLLREQLGISSDEELAPVKERTEQLLPPAAEPIWTNPVGIEYLYQRGIDAKELQPLGVLWHDGAVYVPFFERSQLVGFTVRLKSGQWLYNGPAKQTLLYIIHAPGSDLIVAEGFFDGIKLARLNQPVLILFGRELYQPQQDRLLKIFDSIVLALDADVPGIAASIKIGDQLKDLHNVDLQIMHVPSGRKDFGDSTTKEIFQAYEDRQNVGLSKLLEMRLTTPGLKAGKKPWKPSSRI